MRLPHDLDRLSLDRRIDPAAADTLARDVLTGLLAQPKWLPPKHFYDDRGSRLFEEICALEEYYPTRTEQALLERHVDEIIGIAQPRQLVELGSGSSLKTRLLLDALGRAGSGDTYVPIDISEGMLVQSANALLRRYPWLRVHGVIDDFDGEMAALPAGRDVLLAFLGGTVGNLPRERATGFLTTLARRLGPGGRLLLGTDRVKDPARLEAAYNDARGVTAAFNLNLLQVLNRKLDADFDPAQFRHVAFFDRDSEQIEMHLESRKDQRVRLEKLDLTVEFARGERMRTEISRKFTPESARALLEQAGFEVERHFEPSSGDFSLWLARSQG